MTDVTVIGKADLAGKRLAFGLVEDRIGHYPEFRDFFIRIFGLDHKGLAEPGFVCAPVRNCLHAHLHRPQRRTVPIWRRDQRSRRCT